MKQGHLAVPTRWLVLWLRISLLVATLAFLGAAATGYFVYVAHTNRDHLARQQVQLQQQQQQLQRQGEQLGHQEAVSQCWDRLLGDAVRMKQTRATLIVEAHRCISLGQP